MSNCGFISSQSPSKLVICEEGSVLPDDEAIVSAFLVETINKVCAIDSLRRDLQSERQTNMQARLNRVRNYLS